MFPFVSRLAGAPGTPDVVTLHFFGLVVGRSTPRHPADDDDDNDDGMNTLWAAAPSANVLHFDSRGFCTCSHYDRWGEHLYKGEKPGREERVDAALYVLLFFNSRNPKAKTRALAANACCIFDREREVARAS